MRQRIRLPRNSGRADQGQQVAQPFRSAEGPGLEDEPRSGRRVINDERVESRILDQLAKTPPPGYVRWNGRLVAEALGNVSDDAVWRVMRKHDLHLDRRQRGV